MTECVIRVLPAGDTSWALKSPFGSEARLFADRGTAIAAGVRLSMESGAPLHIHSAQSGSPSVDPRQITEKLLARCRLNTVEIHATASH